MTFTIYNKKMANLGDYEGDSEIEAMNGMLTEQCERLPQDPESFLQANFIITEVDADPDFTYESI